MALDIFDSFATDEKLELEGVWKDIGGDCSLLVARAQNTNYLMVFSELYMQYDDLLSRATAPGATKEVKDEGDARAKEITIETIAKTVLLGWKNLVYKGKPLKYSVENAVMLLQHKDFRVMVLNLASDVDNYRMKLEEDQKKN